MTDSEKTNRAARRLWHLYRRRAWLQVTGSAAMVLVCGTVLAFLDPARLAAVSTGVAVLLVVAVFFYLRGRRHEARPAEPSSFELTTVTYVTTSKVAQESAHGRRALPTGRNPKVS